MRSWKYYEAELLLFENQSLASSTLLSKINWRCSKKMYKKVRLFKWGYVINDIENELETENRSHRYDINRPRPTQDINILDIKCVSV